MAKRPPTSIAALADNAWNSLLEAAFRTGWKPITAFAQSAVVALMENITSHQLRVLTFSHIYEFPTSSATADVQFKAELRVLNDVFWLRLCAMSDLGFAEAYMYGDVECDDLVSLFHIFLDNRENLANLNSRLSYLFTLPQKITSYRFLNTIGNSRSNISAHYDISNDMFAGFLSKDMTYSCAIFQDLDGDLHGQASHTQWSGGQHLKRLTHLNGGNDDPISHPSPKTPDDLHNAQIRKLDHIITKAHILPGQRILELGSGWGSLAIRIAESVPGTTIDTITLSVQQQTLAQERIDAAGFSDRIRVHLMDYRNMPAEWEHVFDRVVSVEMIEAIGETFLETYWRVVDWAMKLKDGVGVVQVITIPEARFDRYIREIDFIRKWVRSFFPGGFLPTLTLLLHTMAAGAQGRFVVDSVANIGPHYARTLREWRRRFLACFDSVVVPALMREHPQVMAGPAGQREVEVFKRKWIYYYCYCEVGFTTRTLGTHIVSFVREGYKGYGCNIYE